MSLRRLAIVTVLLIGGVWLISRTQAEAQAQSTPYRGPANQLPLPPHAVPASADHYHSEAEARRACGSDPVVWVNTASKVVHASGDRYYGKTKHGAYMCRSVAMRQGMHMAHTVPVHAPPPAGTMH